MSAIGSDIIRQSHENIEERTGDLFIISPGKIGSAAGIEEKSISAEKIIPEKDPGSPGGMSGQSKHFKVRIILIIPGDGKIFRRFGKKGRQTIAAAEVI
jgi:hypothetical protein